MPARLRSLDRDERGASLIEFALFLPILALMVMGVTDTAMGYSRKMTLEQAANRTLEKLQTNAIDLTTLQAEAATAAEVETDEVDVNTWVECEGVEMANLTDACADGEQRATYVQIDIQTTYEPQFGYGPLARIYGGSGGLVPVDATAALRIQ